MTNKNELSEGHKIALLEFRESSRKIVSSYKRLEHPSYDAVVDFDNKYIEFNYYFGEMLQKVSKND
jgi:hypothetical protein